MPARQPVRWEHSLPLTLILMSPFDIVSSLGMDFYLPVVPSMPGILGTTHGVVQFTLTIYLVILGLGQIAWGPLSDRIGRRPVLLLGATLFFLASLVLATTSSADVFVGFRVVQAIGASAMLVATFATVRDVFGNKPESALVYSTLGAMLSFVPALGPLAGSLFAAQFGWRAIFLTLAGMTIAATAHAAFRWPETRPISRSRERPTFVPMLRSLTFWTYTFGYSAAMGSFFVYFSTSSRVLIDRAGYSQLAFSLAFGTAAAVMIGTSRISARIVERWGIPSCLRIGMALLISGAILLVIGEATLGTSFLAFVVPMWVISVGIVVTSAVTANGALSEFDRIAGAAVALYSGIQSVIVGIVATAAITLLRGDTAWPLAAFAGGMAALTILVLTVQHRRSDASEVGPGTTMHPSTACDHVA